MRAVGTIVGIGSFIGLFAALALAVYFSKHGVDQRPIVEVRHEP